MVSILESMYEEGINNPFIKIIREFITNLKEEPTQPFSLPDDLEGGHR